LSRERASARTRDVNADPQADAEAAARDEFVDDERAG